MTSPLKDPLLLAGKIFTLFMQAALAIAAIALVIVIPVIAIFRETINERIAVEVGNKAGELPLVPVFGVLALVLIAIVCGFLFFDRLRKIIATVGEGDPFAPVNAERLRGMAWLLLAIQLIELPIAGAGMAIAEWAEPIKGADVNVDAALDLTGILMVLVLFILARVFRHGAAMRDDLEGTV